MKCVFLACLACLACGSALALRLDEGFNTIESKVDVVEAESNELQRSYGEGQGRGLRATIEAYTSNVVEVTNRLIVEANTKGKACNNFRRLAAAEYGKGVIAATDAAGATCGLGTALSLDKLVVGCNMREDGRFIITVTIKSGEITNAAQKDCYTRNLPKIFPDGTLACFVKSQLDGQAAKFWTPLKAKQEPCGPLAY